MAPIMTSVPMMRISATASQVWSGEMVLKMLRNITASGALGGKKVKKLASATLESPIKTFIKMSGKMVRMTIIEA